MARVRNLEYREGPEQFILTVANTYDVVGNRAWFNSVGGPGAGVSLPLSQNLTFSPDNTYSVGEGTTPYGGTLRPKVVYAGTAVVSPLFGSPGGADPDIKFYTNGSHRWTMENTTGGTLFPTSSTIELGKDAATNRIGQIFVRYQINFTEQATPVTPSAGSRGLFFKADGKLYAVNSAGAVTLIGPP